jgi:hypothetical protein
MSECSRSEYEEVIIIKVQESKSNHPLPLKPADSFSLVLLVLIALRLGKPVDVKVTGCAW